MSAWIVQSCLRWSCSPLDTFEHEQRGHRDPMLLRQEKQGARGLDVTLDQPKLLALILQYLVTFDSAGPS